MRCPDCERGRLYRQREPKLLVRVRGMAPLDATVYECEKLRCNGCNGVYTAAAPPDVGEDKYDETASAMVGLLKYGTGLPFTRLEKLQSNLGIPLPASTQWDLVEGAASKYEPAVDELIRQAAQGEVVYNDDTTMKILELMGAPEAPAGEDADERKGVYTTGIISTLGQRQIALFFTGHQHAGENLRDVLAKRAAELDAPIQMCDLLSHNSPGDLETVLGGCNAHARRKYVEVINSFPDECRHVLEELRTVYRNDAVAREQAMSPQERLDYHQAHSSKVMEDLKAWLKAKLDNREVEPNGCFGEAAGFMLRHWDRLTLFLRVAGAPLDNNIAERALKKAILHRKAAYFYKTKNGARVGDLHMSLIHTAELCGANAFEYLVALLRHHEVVAANPAEWMPWNYGEALARLGAPP